MQSAACGCVQSTRGPPRRARRTRTASGRNDTADAPHCSGVYCWYCWSSRSYSYSCYCYCYCYCLFIYLFIYLFVCLSGCLFVCLLLLLILLSLSLFIFFSIFIVFEFISFTNSQLIEHSISSVNDQTQKQTYRNNQTLFSKHTSQTVH